jgi:hypothetical protein
MTPEENPRLTVPVYVVVLDPVMDPQTGEYEIKRLLTIDWSGKGECLALFKSQNSSRLFCSENITNRTVLGKFIRDEEKLLEILHNFQQQGVGWIAVDPSDASDDESQCYSMEEGIRNLRHPEEQ